MANETIKQNIVENIYENHQNEITADVLQGVLLNMVDALAAGAQYMGVATPNQPAPETDTKMVWLAPYAGAYFGIRIAKPAFISNVTGRWRATYLSDTATMQGSVYNAILLNGSGVASGNYSVVEGADCTASLLASHAEGLGSRATAEAAHAEGNGSHAGGTNSHAEGYNTEAGGNNAHAEGNGTEAVVSNCHAEGYQTKASGANAHAENSGTEASGNNSHAEGYHTKATKSRAHAEGNLTQANGQDSHAEGSGTIASNEYEHAEGSYNKSNTGTRHSVGIGTSTTDRKNAFEIMSDGRVYVFGVGGYDGTNAGASGVQTLQQVISNL